MGTFLKNRQFERLMSSTWELQDVYTKSCLVLTHEQTTCYISEPESQGRDHALEIDERHRCCCADPNLLLSFKVIASPELHSSVLSSPSVLLKPVASYWN